MAIAYMISESLIQLAFSVYGSHTYLYRRKQKLKGLKYADGIWLFSFFPNRHQWSVNLVYLTEKMSIENS